MLISKLINSNRGPSRATAVLSNSYARKQINDVLDFDPQEFYFCSICLVIIFKM